MTKKLFNVVLLAFLSVNAITLSAKKCVDDPNFFTVSNCYQKVFGSKYQIGTANTPGVNPTLKFKFLNNGGGTKKINVKIHNTDGLQGLWASGIANAGQANQYYFQGNADIDGNIIVPAEVGTIKINANIFGYVNNGVNSVEIEFVEPEFNFFNPTTEYGCMSFSSLLDFTSNLDGLCDVEFKISCPNPPQGSGIPPSFFIDGLHKGSGFSVPTNEEFCNGALQPLVAQKCVTFNMEIKLKSCVQAEDPDNDPCPPLIINKTIDLCCWCKQGPLLPE